MANVEVLLGQLGAAVNGRLVDLGGDVYALQVALTPVTKAGVPADAMPVSIAAGAAAPPTTFYHGQKAVTTAGTELAIATTQVLVAGIVYVKALPANTGYVYIGKDPVTSATGYPLLAGEEIVILTDNLADIFVDVSVNGEGVAYIGS